MRHTHGPDGRIIGISRLRNLNASSGASLNILNGRSTFSDNKSDIRIRDIDGLQLMSLIEGLLDLGILVVAANTRSTTVATIQTKTTSTTSTVTSTTGRPDTIVYHTGNNGFALFQLFSGRCTDGNHAHRLTGWDFVFFLNLYLGPGPGLHTGNGFSAPANDESDDTVGNVDFFRGPITSAVGGVGGVTLMRHVVSRMGIANHLCDGGRTVRPVVGRHGGHHGSTGGSQLEVVFGWIQEGGIGFEGHVNGHGGIFGFLQECFHVEFGGFGQDGMALDKDVERFLSLTD